MASRVTPADVLGLVSTTSSVEPFIRTATAVVDTHLAPGGLLSASILREIELYLAAHYATVAGLGNAHITSTGALTAKETRKLPSLGQGFLATVYGQQAVALDTTGSLESLSYKRASFEVFPKVDYDEDSL